MKTIEIIVSPSGEVSIDAVGFKGADCEKATAYLEQALGVVAHQSKKPEYSQRTLGKTQQKDRRMNTLVLTIKANGEAGCLYSELIDLQSIGLLEIRRASALEFNQARQQWEVIVDGQALFAHRSRALCQAWEIQHFNR